MVPRELIWTTWIALSMSGATKEMFEMLKNKSSLGSESGTGDQEGIKRGKRKCLGVMDVYYRNCGDGFIGVCMCQIYQIVFILCYCVSIIAQ